MAENTQRTKELSATQEGIIAGLVLLFFGLIYWYLNPWQSAQTSVPVLTGQATTGTVQRSNLPATPHTPVPTATAEITSTTPTQTLPVIPAAGAIAATSTNTAIAVTAAKATHEPVLALPTISTETATTTDSSTQIKSLPAPPGPVEIQTTEILASTNRTAMPEAPKPAPEMLTTETTTSNSTTSTETAKLADPTTSIQTATSLANKLELAPGSPEAQLQTYLENKTLETPVGMEGISFEARTAKLTKESEAPVLLLAALLAQYPQANFLITTYTTETSTENKDSDELSLMRAQALGENLVKAGVEGKRITIMGMGKRPSPDQTAATFKQNQRIEISVIQ